MNLSAFLRPLTPEEEQALHDRYHKPLAVTVLDTVTGRTLVDSENSLYGWTESNWSCDCNRELPFMADDEEMACGTCLGYKRYVVVAVEPMPDGYTLDDFNGDYPEELKAKARGWKP